MSQISFGIPTSLSITNALNVGGVTTLATSLNGFLFATNGVVSTSTALDTSIQGTAGQVLANGTSGSPVTGAIILTLATNLTGITSIATPAVTALTLTGTTNTSTWNVAATDATGAQLVVNNTNSTAGNRLMMLQLQNASSQAYFKLAANGQTFSLGFGSIASIADAITVTTTTNAVSFVGQTTINSSAGSSGQAVILGSGTNVDSYITLRSGTGSAIGYTHGGSVGDGVLIQAGASKIISFLVSNDTWAGAAATATLSTTNFTLGSGIANNVVTINGLNTSGNGAYVEYQRASTVVGRVGTSSGILGVNTSEMAIYAQSAGIGMYVNGGSTASLAIASTGAVTIAGSTAQGLTLNQTSAGSDVFLALQLSATTQGLLGVAGTAGDLVTGSGVGDTVLRTNTKNFILTTDNGTTAMLKVAATTGAVTFSGTGVFAGSSLNVGSHAASTDVNLTLDAVTGNAAIIGFQASGTTKWQIGRGVGSGNNSYVVWNAATVSAGLSIDTTTNAATFGASVTATPVGSRAFISTVASGNSTGMRLTQTSVADWEIQNTATTGLLSFLSSSTPVVTVSTSGTMTLAGVLNLPTSNSALITMGPGSEQEITTSGSTGGSTNLLVKGWNGVGFQTNLTIAGTGAISMGGSLTVSGNLINASDRRLKSDIAPLTSGLDLILKLNPVSYRLNSDLSGRAHFGLIAQEVVGVVGAAHSLVTHDAAADQYGLSYHQLIAPLIRGEQELNAEITALKARVKQLEGATTS